MATTQRISANAIVALKDALSCVFWFKKDLYSFARGAVAAEPTFLAGIPWTDPDVTKRDSVSIFVDRLVREQDAHGDLLIGILVDVANMSDFPQLARCEEPEDKIARAREAVTHLKTLVEPYERHLQQREIDAARINRQREEVEQRRASTGRLAELPKRYLAIMSMPAQRRGYELESLLGELFELYDLNPRSSFRVTGEQVDGGFTLDNEHYLLEAKWQAKPAPREDLDVFAAKLERRSDNTLGLLVAMAGFADSRPQLHGGRRSPLVLMDGMDLYAVLDGRIPLPDLLRRKRRHASMTGEIMLGVSDIV